VFFESDQCRTAVAYILIMNDLREYMIIIVHAKRSDRKTCIETRLRLVCYKSWARPGLVPSPVSLVARLKVLRREPRAPSRDLTDCLNSMFLLSISQPSHFGTKSNLKHSSCDIVVDLPKCSGS
jgi:hypothetical protein